MTIRWVRSFVFIAFWTAFSLLSQSAAALAVEGELDLDRLEDSERTEPMLEEPMPGGDSIENVPEGRFAAELPEEILRTEIITEARSPLTGESLTAVEYAQLQAELASPAGGNLVNADTRYLLFLLQLRRAVRPILPFIP